MNIFDQSDFSVHVYNLMTTESSNRKIAYHLITAMHQILDDVPILASQSKQELKDGLHTQ